MTSNLKSAFWIHHGLGLVGLGIFIGYTFSFFILVPFYAYPQTSDFIAFYTGGTLATHARSLYDLNQQYLVQHALGMPRPFENMLAFYYPPFVALAFVPFTWLSYVPAFWLWTSFSLGAYIGSTYLWSQRCSHMHSKTLQTIILGGLGFLPLIYVFIIGQNTTFTFLLLTLALIAFEEQKDFAAGAWLGGLIYKPQTVFLWGLVLLVQRRWKAVAGAITTGSALLLIATLIWGPQIWVDYASTLTRIEGATADMFQVHVQDMTSWRGWLTKITAWPPAQVSMWAWIISAPILALTLWNWRGEWQPQSERAAWQILATICGTLLAAPHSHIQETFLLWLGALWIAKSQVSQKPMWATLIAGDVLYILHPSSQLPLLTLALFALWIWAIIKTQKQRTHPIAATV